MFKHGLYKQTLKIGLVACFAATNMWMIYLTGAGLKISDFIFNTLYFPLVTIIPIVLSCLLVAKVLIALRVNYSSNAKANTVGIFSVLAIVLFSIIILSIAVGLINLIFKGPDAFRPVDEIYALLYVILIGVVMGSWAIIPLGVWLGNFLKTNSK